MGLYCFYGILCIFCGLRICMADDNDADSLFTKVSEATLKEDGKLDFTQLAVKYGLSVEQYDVTTDDGYILTVFHAAKGLASSGKPPILLFHGIMDSCDTFLIRGNTSMVYALADAGYDVWIGNNRGNLYGRRHVSLNPDTDKKFWDYSLHQIGFYDLAATIDLVRSQTGVDSITTVGHSQGTSAHFVLTSLRPEYNDRIKNFIALAPISFLNHLEPPLSLIAKTGPLIATALKTLGINEVLKDYDAASDLTTLLCSKGLFSYAACGFGVLFPSAGFDPSNLEPDFLTGVVFGHYPRATSRKSLEHYDQIVLRKDFAQYDYGTNENLARYGKVSPPAYDLTAVTTKVALLCGSADGLSKIKDVEQLRGKLPNIVHYEVMPVEQWNHVDFVWGRDILDDFLYPIMFNLLETYT